MIISCVFRNYNEFQEFCHVKVRGYRLGDIIRLLRIRLRSHRIKNGKALKDAYSIAKIVGLMWKNNIREYEMSVLQ